MRCASNGMGDRLWSIILAGGDGERMRTFIQRSLGQSKPKQYCTFVGTRSLFQHTVDRADQLTPPERRIVVTAACHRPHLSPQMRGRESGLVLFQPHNRGTAAGILLPLTLLYAWDPEATVVIYPSDHYVRPESTFLDSVREAVRATESIGDKPVLLGAQPSSADVDFGWIVPASTRLAHGARGVERFVEKPAGSEAEEVLMTGGLWNTFIVASKLEALLQLGWRHVPEIVAPFMEHGGAATAGDLESIYRNLPSRDFSADLLQPASRQLAVLEMKNVYWSDWGRPERVLETLGGLETELSQKPALAAV